MRLRHKLATLLVVVVVACPLVLGTAPASSKGTCASRNHPGGEWRTYGHDYFNTRAQDKEKTIGTVEAIGLRPAWVFSAESGGGSGDFTGTPIIADGCLYAGSNGGWVFAANADTGEPVWATRIKPGGINSTVNVTGGRVFATVSRVSAPYAVALDQDTGKLLWRTTLDTQAGSDIYSSPVVFDGIVFVGVSGGSAELGDESDRYRFQGSYSLLDAATGRVIKKTYTIRPPDKNPDKPKNNHAGGAVWASPAIDIKTKTAYVGTGNPFNPRVEHKHTNAILKIDLDRDSRTFGEIIDSYKGTVDEYFPELKQLPCADFPGNPPPYYPQGAGACTDLDMDFGSSPNIFFDAGGKMLVGEGQKSGVYHAADPTNMKSVWKGLVGPPSAVGGIVGSTAVDENGIYGPITIGGYLWSVGLDSGGPRWFSAVGDGAHWGNAVSVANDVVYTVDLKGFLNAYDAATGVQLLASPMEESAEDLTASWGGVSIARHTVYAAVGVLGLSNGYIVAYRTEG